MADVYSPINMSSNEIMSMQQDAMRRVNEMQRLAKERVGQQSNSDNYLAEMQRLAKERVVGSTPPPPITIKLPYINEETENTAIKNDSGNNLNLPIGDLTGFLDRLNLDPETIMLLMLIFLLINEGADQMLILALGYILL